jgi:mannosyltransferase
MFDSRDWRTAFCLAGVVVLGLALRLPGIGAEPMWIDEAASVGVGSLSWSVILGEFARVEASPPGYYLLAAIAVRIAPDDLLALRIVSAVAGALVSVPVFMALRAEGEARAGWIAALFLAVAATLVRLSVDARCYALLTLCLALGFQAALALARAARSGQPGWTPGLLLGVTMALGIWLHATAGLLAVGLNAAALAAAGRLGWRRLLPSLLLANAAALVLAAWPLFFIVQHVLSDGEFITRWISPPGLADTALLFARTLVAPWQAPFSALSAGLFALGVGLAGLAALRGRSPAAAGALALAGFGLLAFPLVSQWRPVMLDRTILPLLVPLAVLIGLGFTHLAGWPSRPFKGGQRLVLGLAGVFLALQAYGTLRFQSLDLRKEQWPALAAHYAAQAAPGDVLLIPDSVFAAIAFADAARRLDLPVPPMLVLPAASPLEQAAARHLASWRAMAPGLLCATLGPRDGVWVAHRPMPPAVMEDPGFTTLAPVVAAVEAEGARLTSTFSATGMALRHWSGPVCAATPAAGG